MNPLPWIITALEVHIRRHGQVPLSNTDLLRIACAAQRLQARDEARVEAALAESLGDDAKWGAS